MDRFLANYNLPRLNYEEKENLNEQITSKEIESVIINFPQRKAQDQMASLVNSTKCLKKNEQQSFTNSSQKQKMRENFPTHSVRPILL